MLTDVVHLFLSCVVFLLAATACCVLCVRSSCLFMLAVSLIIAHCIDGHIEVYAIVNATGCLNTVTCCLVTWLITRGMLV
jgi:hypothetical protein